VGCQNIDHILAHLGLGMPASRWCNHTLGIMPNSRLPLVTDLVLQG